MKKLAVISTIILILGWFPFMWISVYGSHHREHSELILFLGIFMCLVGAVGSISIIGSKSFWLNEERIQKEIDKYIVAKKKYEQATLDLVKIQEIK